MAAQIRTMAVAQLGAQQKDNLCGPFWAARVLVEAGFPSWGGEPVDQDLIAHRAGTTLPGVTAEPCVPPGASSLTDYRYRLPVATEDESGTSVSGLMAAIEAASGGCLHCVPIRGSWSAVGIERLVEEAVRLEVRLIANLRTGRLWGSHATNDAILAELDGKNVEGPAADWDVGHFVELETLVRGLHRSLVVVHDSYPTLGRQGRHLQPPRAVAAALERGDGREGGVIAVTTQVTADTFAAFAADLGLEVGLWNNGSRS